MVYGSLQFMDWVAGIQKAFLERMEYMHLMGSGKLMGLRRAQN